MVLRSCCFPEEKVPVFSVDFISIQQRNSLYTGGFFLYHDMEVNHLKVISSWCHHVWSTELNCCSKNWQVAWILQRNHTGISWILEKNVTGIEVYIYMWLALSWQSRLSKSVKVSGIRDTLILLWHDFTIYIYIE